MYIILYKFIHKNQTKNEPCLDKNVANSAESCLGSN